MNVLIVIHTPKDPYTAIYHEYSQLARFLESHGHHVAVLSPEDFVRLNRFHARWWPLLFPFGLAGWLWSRSRDYDVVVFLSYSGWLVNLLAAAFPAYRRPARITAFQGLDPLYYRRLKDEMDRTGRSLRLRFRLAHGAVVPWLIALSCRRSDWVMCLSDEEATFIVDHGWARRSALTVVSNSVSAGFFIDRVHRPHASRLLFVGQWLEMKGIRYLVEAFQVLADANPTLELHCVGTLVDEASVMSAFPTHLQHRVTVRPRVTRGELVEILRNVDIFVFPSLSEGFSKALLEAMATALPIVATPVGAAASFLEDGVSVLTVPSRDAVALADAIRRLLQADVSMRERLGRAAQARAREFEAGEVHGKTTCLLRDVVNTKVAHGAVGQRVPVRRRHGRGPAPESINVLFVVQVARDPLGAVYVGYERLKTFLERQGASASILTPDDFPWLTRLPRRLLPLTYPLFVGWRLGRQRRNYDLLLFHSYAGWLVHLVQTVWPRNRVRTITALHGLEPLYYRELKEEGRRIGRPLSARFRLVHGALVPWLTRWSCYRSDRVTCLNSREAAYLARDWHLGTKVDILRKGVPQDFFIRRQHSDRPRRLLFVGQWLPAKGTRYLVEAFAALAPDEPDLELWCVGTLVDEAKVRRDFPQALHGRVHVRPRLEREEIQAVYREADIFVLPSLYEAFGNVFLEAMAIELPIVATPVGAAADLLEGERSALIVPTRDGAAIAGAVRRLLEDKALRERLGREAQAIARRHELDKAHQRVWSLFQDVVA